MVLYEFPLLCSSGNNNFFGGQTTAVFKHTENFAERKVKVGKGENSNSYHIYSL